MKKARRLFIRIALLVVLAIGLLYFFDQKTMAPKFAAANYIAIEKSGFFIRAKGESSQQFQNRVLAFAAQLTSKFERVTIKHYIDENGSERAVITVEKKIWK